MIRQCLCEQPGTRNELYDLNGVTVIVKPLRDWMGFVVSSLEFECVGRSGSTQFVERDHQLDVH